MKSGNLNFLELSGPLQACNGTALTFTTYVAASRCRGRDGISSTTPASSNIGGLYQKLYIQSRAPDDGRKHLPKTVQLIGYKEINQKFATCWSSITNYIIPYPTAFPYRNGMVLHFYQQQESSTTETVHKVINKGLKSYV